MRPLTHRDERRRHPWWAKAVERPTTEFDLEKTSPAAPLGLMRNPEYLQKVNVGWEPLGRQIGSGAPGRSLRDSALHWGFSTCFTRSLHPAGGAELSTTPVHQLLRAHVPTPEQLGVDPWEGSAREASATVEHAAIQFGAAQVGFEMRQSISSSRSRARTIDSEDAARDQVSVRSAISSPGFFAQPSS